MATAHLTAPPRAQLGPLGWIALIPAIAVLAHGEWSLAVACGVHPYVAVGVPAALDIYAVRALRAGREVLPVVLVMVAVNGASHLVSTGLISITPGLVIACSAIPAYVLWRVHAIGTHTATVDQAAAVTDDAPTAAPDDYDVEPTLADAYGPSTMPRIIYMPPRPTTPPAVEPAPHVRPTPTMRRIVAPVTAVPDTDAPVTAAPTPVDVAQLTAAPIPASLDPAARVVAQLYRDLGHEPITSEIADALKAAGLSYKGGTPRDVRTRARAGDRTLAHYPPHPTRRSMRAAG